jgi:hypothetical protein
VQRFVVNSAISHNFWLLLRALVESAPQFGQLHLGSIPAASARR